MNLDIEGTKHEKVVIIVLAYVMGFTAGFICFGVGLAPLQSQNQVHSVAEVSDVMEDEVGDTSVNPVGTMSSDAATPDEAGAPETVLGASTESGRAATASGASVTYENGKLQAQIGENTYLLSMKSTDMSSAALDAFKNQGVHTDIPAYSVSPDGKFVYFCEQSGTDDACTNFTFDVANNVISYVTVNGQKLVTSGAVAKAATWSQNGLTIDGHTSINSTTPSALTQR